MVEGRGVLFKLAPFNSRLYLKDDKVCLLEFALFFSDVSRQLLFFKRFFGLLRVAEVSSILNVSCKCDRRLFSKERTQKLSQEPVGPSPVISSAVAVALNFMAYRSET